MIIERGKKKKIVAFAFYEASYGDIWMKFWEEKNLDSIACLYSEKMHQPLGKKKMEKKYWFVWEIDGCGRDARLLLSCLLINLV